MNLCFWSYGIPVSSWSPRTNSECRNDLFKQNFPNHVPARGVKRQITESAKMWRISLQLLCYSMRGSEGEWDKPAKSPSRSMNCACSTQIAVRQNKPQQSKLLWWRFLNFRILLSLTPYFGIYSLKWAPKILLLLLFKMERRYVERPKNMEFLTTLYIDTWCCKVGIKFFRSSFSR